MNDRTRDEGDAVAPLEFTGERFMPEHGGVQIHFEHLQRYLVAASLLKPGAVVLDYGSGEGYGSSLLAESAAQVLGVDVSPSAVANAATRYGNPRLKYQVIDSATVPLPDASVDVVTCFEVIEHLADQKAVVAELSRVLKPDGLLLMSTPERRTYTDEVGYQNPFHISEMTFQEFDDLLGTRFPERVYYRQRFTAASFLLPSARLGPGAIVEKSLAFTTGRHGAQLERPEARASSAVYYLAVCGTQRLPASVQALAEVIVDDRDAFVAESNAQLEKLKKHIMVLEGGVAERDTELGRLRARVQELELRVASLGVEVTVGREERDLRARRLEELLGELEQHQRRVHELERGLERAVQVAVEREEQAASERRLAQAELARAQTELARAHSNELARALQRADAAERRLSALSQDLEQRKQHIMRLEGGVRERDGQIELLARELLEIKQSGALRVGRVLSRLVPTALKHKAYQPFRKSEASEALQALGGWAPASQGAPLQGAAAATEVAAAAPVTPAVSGPTFAFVVPVFNHANYLPTMIESLLGQTRKADEIILVDDCSPDPAVRDVLRRYDGRPGFKVLYTDQNVGISAATNVGIRAATSSHLAFVDCDDVVDAKALELVEQFLRERPGVDFVYTNRVDIDADGNEVQRWDFKNRAVAPPHEALMIGMFTSHLKVMSAAALRDVGAFKPRYDLSQDYDLALRLAERRQLGHLNAYVYRHRVHQKQQSQVNAEAQEAMTQQIRGDSQRRLSWRATDAARSVSVVMLTHNRPDITRQAVDSLLNTLRGNFELIIFDNASDAPTVSMLRGYAKDRRVKLTFAERNFGVSGGRRRAAKAATGDYLFFIDSDIVIDDADLLVKLIERLEDAPDAGACCCRVVFPNGEVQFNGGRLEQVRPGVVRFGLIDSGKRIDDLSTLEERECEWIPGGATMWRRDAHERFEPSDKMLGAFEDNEMCLRVRKAGVRLLNCPTATVTHYHHTFRQEHDTRYLQSRYDRERIITSMGVLLRDHGLLVHDDDLYRMVGLTGLDQAAIVARLQQAADAGKTNETA